MAIETHIFLLGRNPELSIEELLVVLKPLGHIVEVNRRFVVFQGAVDGRTILTGLGGTIKVGTVLHSLDSWDQFTVDMWQRSLRSELQGVSGRFTFGSSVYSDNARLKKEIHARGLELKKRLRLMSLSVRFVANREGVLSSVAVQKNNLIGREFLFLEGKKNYVALTTAVQDFEFYSLRDYGRPSRNTERGMLPPKVAQVMLNLAQVKKSHKILDPFCGGGTIVHEALFGGLTQVWGSDKDERAIEEARKNSDWLSHKFNLPHPVLEMYDVYHLEKAYEPNFFDAVVTEPFLGPARLLKRRSLTRSQLATITAESATLYAQLFKELSIIMKPGGRLVIIFPVYRVLGGEHSVGNLDVYERGGWELIQPVVKHYYADARLSARGQLLYAREDQVVAREITMWRKA